MVQFSNITNKAYDDSACVFFRNYVQAAYYIEWGAILVDLFVDSEHKLVFVFNKADHEKFKLRWGTKNKEYFENKK